MGNSFSLSGLYWPTSSELLAHSEARLLQQVQRDTPYTVKDVALDDSGERVMHTLAFESCSLGQKRNLVLTHGFGAGVGVFYKNYSALAKVPGLNVYSVDWLGMGASSRPHFGAVTAAESEEFFVEALEQWRQKMGLESFVLAGHSLGGYLSTVYALRFPHRVSKLILISPVGIPKKPEEPKQDASKSPLARRPWLYTAVQKLWDLNITPQSLVRLSGHFGPAMVRWFVSKRFELQPEEQVLFEEYIYHISAARCSGELAFNTILSFGAWARSPLIDRMPTLRMPTTFIYGLHDWMDRSGAVQARKAMGVPTEIITISGGGHQMYFENAPDFNKQLIREIQSAPLYPPVLESKSADAPTETSKHFAAPAAEASFA